MKFVFSLLFVAILLLNGEGINGAPTSDGDRSFKSFHFTYDDSSSTASSLKICLNDGASLNGLNSVQLVVGDPAVEETDFKKDVSLAADECVTFDNLDSASDLPTTTSTLSYELVFTDGGDEKSIGPIVIDGAKVGKEYTEITCGGNIYHRYEEACNGHFGAVDNTVDDNCYGSADTDYFLSGSVEVYGLTKKSTDSVTDISPTASLKRTSSGTPTISLSSTYQYIMITDGGDATYGACAGDDCIPVTGVEMTICAVGGTGSDPVSLGTVGPFKDIGLDAASTGTSGDYVNVGFTNNNDGIGKYFVGVGAAEGTAETNKIKVDCSALSSTAGSEDTCYAFLKPTDTTNDKTIYAQYSKDDFTGAADDSVKFYYELA